MRDINLLLFSEMTDAERERFRDDWIDADATGWARETDLPKDIHLSEYRYERYCEQEGWTQRDEHIANRREALLKAFPDYAVQVFIEDAEEGDSLGELILAQLPEAPTAWALFFPDGSFVRNCEKDGTPLKQTDGFDTSKLEGISLQAAETILDVMRKHGEPHSGGCKCFYSPEEWAARGEDYGQNAVLIVVHDGGDQAKFFNWDYECYELIDEICKALAPLRLLVEQHTCWYSAIYKV